MLAIDIAGSSIVVVKAVGGIADSLITVVDRQQQQ